MQFTLLIGINILIYEPKYLQFVQTCVDILSQKWFLPTLLPEIWVLRKILEFWRKNGLSFDQNVEKKSLK